jgi:hypothetical protein
MPLEAKPNPMPSALDYVPPLSEPYKVLSSDSWWTLAEKPGPLAAGLSALDLCYFNFRTRKPTEINWYLRNKVGCKTATSDGKNFKFSMADNPGIVYLPVVGVSPPAAEYPIPIEPAPDPTFLSDVWMGVGVKAGSMIVVVGIDTMGGVLISLDASMRYAGVSGEVNRLGLGAGVGGGAVILIATGVTDPSQIHGLQSLAGDFNVSLGAKWGHFAKLGKMRKLQPFVDAFMKIGAKTPGSLKAALKSNPDNWINLYKNSASLKDALGVGPNDPPSLMVLDMPFVGAGTEVSLFYGLTTLTLLDSGKLGGE